MRDTAPTHKHILEDAGCDGSLPVSWIWITRKTMSLSPPFRFGMVNEGVYRGG